ncbi:MAG: zinc ribbon domain-containing protein [Anaerolineae bacterium]|nr:zinc ribbon domain-containing protein [Anaerolineae bacterium]
MTIPGLDTLVNYVTIFFAIFGALLAALWLSLIIWTFRDMRLRSRDPFAQILAALVVAALPAVGLLIYVILRPPETLAEAYERALEEEALLQEIEERPACPGCSRTVEANWMLCPHCHTRLKKVCPDCNSLMELQWNLCPFCGNRQIDPYMATPPAIERPVYTPLAEATAARYTENGAELEPMVDDTRKMDEGERMTTEEEPMTKEG